MTSHEIRWWIKYLVILTIGFCLGCIIHPFTLALCLTSFAYALYYVGSSASPYAN